MGSHCTVRCVLMVGLYGDSLYSEVCVNGGTIWGLTVQ